MGEFQHDYQFMFDNMAQGAFFQLADGSLVDVNAAALGMLGISREELTDRTSQHPSWRVIREDGSVLSGDQHPSMVALSTGEAVRNFVAGVFNPQKQSFVWMNINAVPVFRPDEKAPYKVFVTLHDITEEKRLNDIHLSRIHLMQFADFHSLDELLVEALDQLELLTDSHISFYHFYDEKAQCVSLKAWSTATKGLPCLERRLERHSIHEAGVWAQCVLENKVVIHNDYSALPNRRGLPEGHPLVIRELLVPVKRNGQIVGILGMGNKPIDYTEADVNTVSIFADLTWDIVEHKRAETSLLHAKRELEALTSTSMEGYWIFNAEGRIVYANETCCQTLGYTMQELLTRRLREFEAIEDDAELAAHLALIREKGYDRFETCLHHKNGELVDVEVSAAYLCEREVILAFTRNITAQKLMQKELLESRNELELANLLLEQRVNERTAELRAAIREQESFSYSVSHDLRAPLRHINSFSAILMEDYGAELSAEARGYLERMRGAANRMGALIDHLLELSRVIRAEIKLAEVDLSDLAAAALRMLGETEPRREVEQRIEPGLKVRGDEQLLTQLLENLMQNAWKYSSRKQPSCIEFGRKVVLGKAIYFVKDNGAGFDMKYRDNLFKPFERLHGSEFEGIGIGLATAQRIVHRHGGSIWGEGAENEGATFYFTLH